MSRVFAPVCCCPRHHLGGVRPKGCPEKRPEGPCKPAGISPTKADVAYGTHPRQVLDFYQAKSDTPTPVVFAIHGGGWVSGDKGGYRASAKRYLDAGISVVAINYRFVTEATEKGIEPPVKWPLEDAARALQFVRSKAKEWNLDKTRIGATGGSAGGCSSLWLVFHDDLADPKSADPVARESTRLYCAAVNGAADHARPEGAARVDAERPLRRPRLRHPHAEGTRRGVPGVLRPAREAAAVDQGVLADHARHQGRPAGVPGVPSPEEAAGEGRGAGRPDPLGPARHDPDGEAEGEGVEGILVYPGHPHEKYKTSADFLIDRLSRRVRTSDASRIGFCGTGFPTCPTERFAVP